MIDIKQSSMEKIKILTVVVSTPYKGNPDGSLDCQYSILQTKTLTYLSTTAFVNDPVY